MDEMYARPFVGTVDGYLYSPAFAQAFYPLTVLPFGTVELIWRTLLVAATATMAGPFTLIALFLSPVASEINVGNVDVLIGLVVVAGYRWPAAWAFVLLTKVTPGVGLLWFAARREWRQLGVALGATLAVCFVSLLLSPGSWPQWLAVLAANTIEAHAGGSFPVPVLLPVPLLIRLPLAALLVSWAARTNRRPLLPVAVFLALPVVWFTSLSLLLAVIPLSRPGAI
jgi:hypothetical protein